MPLHTVGRIETGGFVSIELKIMEELQSMEKQFKVELPRISIMGDEGKIIDSKPF